MLIPWDPSWLPWAGRGDPHNPQAPTEMAMVLPLPTPPGSSTVSKGSAVSAEVYLGAPFLGAKKSTRAAVGAPLCFLGT